MNDYLRERRKFFERYLPDKVGANMMSEENWLLRGKVLGCKDLGIKVRVGDICWLDYGQSYINEMGYQHFGLIVALCFGKALVVPITSSKKAYYNAYDLHDNKKGNYCLMRLGDIKGLDKESTLYLNDFRFINSARVFGVYAHIERDSELFKKIVDRLYMMLVLVDDEKLVLK